jgi:hypothetical protein
MPILQLSAGGSFQLTVAGLMCRLGDGNKRGWVTLYGLRCGAHCWPLPFPCSFGKTARTKGERMKKPANAG